MRNINLYLIFFFFWMIIEFLLDFKKAFFNFFFYFWLQLSLHIVHFQILTFEVFQWVRMLLIANVHAIWHLNILIWNVGESAALIYSIILVFINLIHLHVLLLLVDILRRIEVWIIRILHHRFKCIIFVKVALNELGIV